MSLPPLVGSDSVWILYSGEPRESKDYLRFILDIEWGAKCLVNAGVSPNKIICFLDFIHGDPVQADLVSHGYTVFLEKDFYAELSKINSKVIIFASTGHGNINGISGTTTINPVPLVDALKKVSNLQVVLLVLAQCYSGVFDYLDVKGTPATVIMGATRLHTSISSGTIGLQHCANIFWAYFFNWIQQPVDVDADGIFTAADAFKYSALMTNNAIKNIKTSQTMTFESWCLEKIRELETIADTTLKTKKEDDIKKQADIYHTHQEPWILNANVSRSILLK